MRRIYDLLAIEHLRRFRQMLFLAGPRQVGKTTCSLHLKEETGGRFIYLNWDVVDHRQLLTGNLASLEPHLGLQELSALPIVVVFDEIHKFARWKSFLKGFFDLYGGRVKIVVTGSARLNAYRAGGDSLMGRYFLYRMHPLSVGEVLRPTLVDAEIRAPSKGDPELFDRLLTYGGFPEPFTMQDPSFTNQWSRLRHKQLFQEDLRDLRQIHEVALVEVLANLLRHQAGQLTAYSQLAKKLGVTASTAKSWLAALESLFYCYSIRPWAKNVTRSLIKEPKYYLYDWSLIDERGARLENFVASHLLKAVHFWNDRGMGDYGLYYLRDKEKRETDFVVTKEQRPWFLVEVKASKSGGLTKSLLHFQQQLQAPHAFQVVFDLDFVEQDCFSATSPTIVPAATFLSQLP